jgi:leucyl aminopeptidase
MKVSLSTEAPHQTKSDLLAIGVRAGQLGKDRVFQQIDRATGGALVAAAEVEDFTGKSGETLKVAVRGLAAPVVLVVGLGEGAPHERDARLLGVKAAQAASGCRSVSLVLPENTSDRARAVRLAAEGLSTGAYKFTRYLTGNRLPRRRVDAGRILVAQGEERGLRDALRAGTIVADAVNLARDLVNAPPNDMTPTALADAARTHGEAAGLKVKVWDKKGIEQLGMHLFLAVNRGSAEEPRFVHMVWKPASVRRNGKRVAFVGKGLTFDSGGLCIKPPKSMLDMKCDMAGAAVTIGVMLACARLQLPVEVHGFFGATENMTGAAAYRPGDVFPTLDGKTVEIINTDAEGRLVLADVLTYVVRKIKPDYVIDHATLTGACMVALGPWTAGLFANDDELAQAYQEAARTEGESVWRMPLDEDLRELLKSDVADLKHVGDQYGGSITAALFLREFVGKTKWAHLDIAGPAFLERPHGVYPKGGTGFGVATGIRFLETLAASVE